MPNTYKLRKQYYSIAYNCVNVIPDYDTNYTSLATIVIIRLQEMLKFHKDIPLLCYHGQL